MLYDDTNVCNFVGGKKNKNTARILIVALKQGLPFLSTIVQKEFTFTLHTHSLCSFIQLSIRRASSTNDRECWNIFLFFLMFTLKKFFYLLTYLIGHNNPINGIRPAATLPSRRFCSLRAYASWLHHSMTRLPRFDLSNECKVVLFADFRRSPHQIPVSPEHPPPYERHGRASAAAGY